MYHLKVLSVSNSGVHLCCALFLFSHLLGACVSLGDSVVSIFV
jgi:hypothetical protein